MAYMIDQSHNLKGKIEATVQTVVTAQELYLKAALVDREKLAELQQDVRPGGRRRAVSRRFLDDVRPLTRAWREARGLPADPLAALRDQAVTWSAWRASGHVAARP
jgi:L-rhamnose isomerase / sugar isomerase